MWTCLIKQSMWAFIEFFSGCSDGCTADFGDRQSGMTASQILTGKSWPPSGRNDHDLDLAWTWSLASGSTRSATTPRTSRRSIMISHPLNLDGPQEPEACHQGAWDQYPHQGQGHQGQAEGRVCYPTLSSWPTGSSFIYLSTRQIMEKKKLRLIYTQ